MEHTRDYQLYLTACHESGIEPLSREVFEESNKGLYLILARKPNTNIVVNIKIGYSTADSATAALKYRSNTVDEHWGYMLESEYNRLIGSGEL
jgi:hypothetical protein